MTDREQHSKQHTAGQDGKQTHSEDGVDLTLIRWMLSLTPAERLKVLQDTIRSFKRLTNGIHQP